MRACGILQVYNTHMGLDVWFFHGILVKINIKFKPQQDCHGQGKYLENENFSRLGKSQGILWMAREI